MDDGEALSGIIVTPEAVVLDLDTGGIVTRLLSGLVDLVSRGVLGVLLSGIIVLAGGSANAFQYALVFFLVLGYPILCETVWNGRTIGKLTLGLRVVTVDGSPIRFRHAVLRGMGGLVDFFLPPMGITGMMFVWGSRRNQRLGDLLAGTIVVRDKAVEYSSAATWFSAPYGLDGYAETIDPTPLRNDDYTLVRSFLLRVHQLTPAARFATADRLATGVASRLRVERPPTVHPEAFLLCVMARYQRQTVPAVAVPSDTWNRP